jgi:hypothetical protein
MNVIDADLAKAKLESEGIKAFVFDDLSRLYSKAVMIGVRLQVHEADAQRALEILNEDASDVDEQTDADPPEPEPLS